MAIWIALHQIVDAEYAICARLVFDDDGLTEALLQVFGITRAVRSMLPPGAYGTMIRIVLLGNVSACAGAANAAAASKQISHFLNDPGLYGIAGPRAKDRPGPPARQSPNQRTRRGRSAADRAGLLIRTVPTSMS